MERRPASTETGWILAKALVLVVVFGTLVGVTVLSHVVSHASAGRIDCLDNQRATYEAVLDYQAAHDGRSPANLDLFGCNPHDPSAYLGRCPVNEAVKYRVDATSGRVLCANPSHGSAP